MESAVVVVSNADGRKYKLVVKGDLAHVHVFKIKRYLHAATGIEPSEMALSFNNRVVDDHATGLELGLFDGAVMFLDKLAASPVTYAAPSAPVAHLLAQREEEAGELREQLHAIRARPESNSNVDLDTDVERKLKRTLVHLASELSLSEVPAMDANHTSVVPVSASLTLLLTFDPATSRIYMYSTLLSSLPQDSHRRLRLYEALLEGALLGREMAGGGVGVSVKNELILLSVSVDLVHSDERCLSKAAVPFIEAHTKWSRVCQEALS